MPETGSKASAPAGPRPPGRAAAWWLAARPKTLSLAVVPVIVGSVLAWAETGALAWPAMAAALLAAALIQVGTNLHNDAADFMRGADGPDRLGPQRAAATGWLSVRQVLAGAYAAFGGAFLLGVYLAWVGGWPIVAVGLLALAAGLAYTGGPRPIAYTSLGELFVFLFFGVVAVAGSYYLQTGRVTPAALLLGCALGGFAAAVLVVNNYRDLEADRRADKHTLAGLLGPAATKALYAALVSLPFPLLLAPPVRVLLGGAGWAVAAALPAALYLAYRFARTRPGPAFNRLLARTAQLQLLFGTLVCLGLATG